MPIIEFNGGWGTELLKMELTHDAYPTEKIVDLKKWCFRAIELL